MKNNLTSSLSFPRGFKKYSELICASGIEGARGGETPVVLVALSGGADSVALFDLTARLCEAEGGYFYACHVNHGIRGDEAIRDRDFCVELAKNCKYCKEIFVLNADVPAIAKDSGESLESAARRVRYEFFERVMEENKIDILATAHNADDNLETLLFNLVRGSGAKGMRGIPPVRTLPSGRPVVRPILEMSKAEILAYCGERGLRFVTDSTNFDTEYSRNLIRNEIVPLLERINPALRTHATELASDMRALYSLALSKAQAAIDGGEGVALEALNSLHPSALPEALSRAIEQSGLSCELERVHVEALAELAKKGEEHSSISLPNRLRGKILNRRLVFEPDSRETVSAEDYSIAIKKGENPLPDGSTLLWLDGQLDGGEENVYTLATKISIDFDKIDPVARNRREGDKITVKGVRKSVKKLMCDQKLDRSLRDRIPLICDGDTVLCIPGVAVSDSAFAKKGKSNAVLVWNDYDK